MLTSMPYRTVGPSPHLALHADSFMSKGCQLIAHMHGARAPGRDDTTLVTHPRYLSDPLDSSNQSCRVPTGLLVPAAA